MVHKIFNNVHTPDQAVPIQKAKDAPAGETRARVYAAESNGANRSSAHFPRISVLICLAFHCLIRVQICSSPSQPEKRLVLARAICVFICTRSLSARLAHIITYAMHSLPCNLCTFHRAIAESRSAPET